MATPDFSKIWASASPLPEFVFTDAEYTTGWDFVGSAPPTKNQFDAWFRYVDERLKWLFDQMEATASKLYPVGSVYISFDATDPSTLFGGTWSRLKDTFLLASGDSYAPNTTGGSATKTIAVSNMPAHNHSVSSSGSHSHSATTSANGSHTHTASTNGNHTHKYATRTGTGLSGNVAETQTSAGGYNGNMSSNGSHTHTIGSAGSHTHTVNITSSGSHTHTTNNTGGGLPLNIMPPYQTVYMWRRTA